MPTAETVNFAVTPLGTWLLGFVPWTQAEHPISAISGQGAIAKALGFEPMAACLSLERRTWRGEDPITYVRLMFPGESYDLVARFSPSTSRSRDAEPESK